MTDDPNILFVSPKRGGILQSSGFLDLKSLIALNRTCKANALDELSLIVLIENEITRSHGVQTMEEAIEYWRNVCRSKSLLKQWLERDRSCSSTVVSIKVTHHMLSCALPYEVMFSKMIRIVPTQSERLRLISEKDVLGRTLLHDVAESGNYESLKTALTLYPESERLPALGVTTRHGSNVLHCVADSNNIECIKAVLSLYPESQHLEAANMQNTNGETMLDIMDAKTREAIVEWLSKSEETNRTMEWIHSTFFVSPKQVRMRLL